MYAYMAQAFRVPPRAASLCAAKMATLRGPGADPAAAGRGLSSWESPKNPHQAEVYENSLRSMNGGEENLSIVLKPSRSRRRRMRLKKSATQRSKKATEDLLSMLELPCAKRQRLDDDPTRILHQVLSKLDNLECMLQQTRGEKTDNSSWSPTAEWTTSSWSTAERDCVNNPLLFLRGRCGQFLQAQ